MRWATGLDRGGHPAGVFPQHIDGGLGGLGNSGVLDNGPQKSLLVTDVLGKEDHVRHAARRVDLGGSDSGRVADPVLDVQLHVHDGQIAGQVAGEQRAVDLWIEASRTGIHLAQGLGFVGFTEVQPEACQRRGCAGSC